MPYACVCSGATPGDLQQPTRSNPQLTGDISPPTSCIRMRTQDPTFRRSSEAFRPNYRAVNRSGRLPGSKTVSHLAIALLGKVDRLWWSGGTSSGSSEGRTRRQRCSPRERRGRCPGPPGRGSPGSRIRSTASASNPNLRRSRQSNPLLTRASLLRRALRSVYFGPILVGIGAPTSSNARRCSAVGSANLSTRTPPANTTVLRVKVAR